MPEIKLSKRYKYAGDIFPKLIDLGFDLQTAQDLLNSIEDADVVVVVRCKNCKHSYFVKSCSKYECRKGCGTLKYANDFCSYGEREEV